MNTTRSGRDAEALVAEHLCATGHVIISQNWRTRWCEIDIVSKKDECIYFTEVKFRSSTEWGGGFEYITPKKIQQIRFAAELWISSEKWDGDVILQGAEVKSNQSIEIVEL